MGKRRINGKIVDHDPIDSWLHGDFVTKGDGMTTRAMRFLVRMLNDPDIVGPVREKYGKILVRWV